MKPTSTAANGKTKKNAEPIRPNCSGLSFSSSMIGLAASPITILSAKLINMNKKIRAVTPHAPLRGRSGNVMRRI